MKVNFNLMKYAGIYQEQVVVTTHTGLDTVLK